MDIIKIGLLTNVRIVNPNVKPVLAAEITIVYFVQIQKIVLLTIEHVLVNLDITIILK